MYLFDTNHISVWLRGEGKEFEALAKRVQSESAIEVLVSIISFQEMINGWNAFAAKKRASEFLIRAYSEFETLISTFSEIPLLSFDEKAAEVYEQLLQRRLRVGTLDLRIAAIAIANRMTLVTRNQVDFQRITDLTIDDWIS